MPCTCFNVSPKYTYEFENLLNYNIRDEPKSERAGVRWHEFKQTKRNMLCVRVTDAKKIRFGDTCLMHDSSKLKPLCTAVLHSSIAF